MSITLVQQTNENSGTVLTNVLNGVAKGNTLICEWAIDGSASPSFSDNQGNNWVIAISNTFNDDFENRTSGIAYASNVAGGNTTLTVNGSGNIARAGMQEWSTGIATTYFLLDQTATGIGSPTAMSTGNVTTLFNNELLIGTFFNGGVSIASSAGSGYTALNGFINVLFNEYQIVSSTGTYNATATSGASANTYGGCLATFNISPRPIFNTVAGRFNSSNILQGQIIVPIWTSANVTPVTVNANVSTDQSLMSAIIPANTLNAVGRTLRGVIKSVYSTPAASTATLEIKVKLGTLTLLDITTTANAGSITNNGFRFDFDITTQTAGSSAKFETSGTLIIDLGATTGAAASVFTDANSGVSSTLDSTVDQTLQITVAFSSASGSNSCTQRQLILNTIN